MGLFGVAIAYLALGAFYKWVHSCVVDAGSRSGNIVATVLYSYLIFLLLSLLAENFDIAFVKNMTAVAAFLFILKVCINKPETPGAGARGEKSPAVMPAVLRAHILK
jgi:hypothetical protein